MLKKVINAIILYVILDLIILVLSRHVQLFQFKMFATW